MRTLRAKTRSKDLLLLRSRPLLRRSQHSLTQAAAYADSCLDIMSAAISYNVIFFEDCICDHRGLTCKSTLVNGTTPACKTLSLVLLTDQRLHI
jgi:hypothetical protein